MYVRVVHMMMGAHNISGKGAHSERDRLEFTEWSQNDEERVPGRFLLPPCVFLLLGRTI